MAVVRRFLIAILLLGTSLVSLGASPETRAFTAAYDSFRAGFYQRAETEFGQFAQTFTNSSRLPEAILLQAQSRIQLTNYAGAIELLSAREQGTGNWRPHYEFWLAETFLRKGDYREAASRFAKVLAGFPAFPRQLEAAVGQATAHARLGEWPAVVNLLTNGVFQAIVRTNAAAQPALQGFLLLGEAQFNLKNYRGAESALAPMSSLRLDPKTAWERQYLLCRAQVADGRFEPALQGVTNLLALATNTTQRLLLAESRAFQAGLFERLGRTDEAVEAYRKNLAEGVSPERLRQALEKIAELWVATNKLSNAATILDQYVAEQANSKERDLALLLAGELRLREYQSGRPEGTNLLQRAETALQELISKYPESSNWGKAQLDLGWCLWLESKALQAKGAREAGEAKLVQSQSAFRAAAERLPDSADRATAYCKLADAQFQQGDVTNAYNNYRVVIDRFAGLPEVRTNFLELALYQSVRAATAAKDLQSATNALNDLLASFPSGFYNEGALLLTGRLTSRQESPAAARAVYSEFANAFPNAPRLADVRLAIAHTYEQENDWTNAIAQYDTWLAAYTNHAERPRAEYYCGLASFQAGRDTNALTCFSNVVAQFAASEFTPLAQWWIADYHFRTGAFREAELDYQLLFRSTNWPSSELNYQAQLMAGRSAAARRIWPDARDYFTKLCNDTNCPASLRGQAFFALGDTLMSMDAPETNRMANYDEAIRVFSKIGELYPSNELAVLACGQKANCLLQWAEYSSDYQAASNSFQQVIDSALADARARSIAKVGVGLVLEKQAALASTNGAALLNLALNQYLDVFYCKQTVVHEGELPDAFWTKEAGIRAGRLAESLHEWQQAIGIYEQLQEKFPAIRSKWEKIVSKLHEQIAAAPVPSP